MTAGVTLKERRSADWYATVKFKVSMSVPYILHALPASLNVAVRPYGVRTTFEAVYPGHTDWASTAWGSSILGITLAPVEADGGTVNNGLNDVVVLLAATAAGEVMDIAGAAEVAVAPGPSLPVVVTLVV